MANEGNAKPKKTLEERAKEIVRDVLEAIERWMPLPEPSPQLMPAPARRRPPMRGRR